MLEEWEVRLYVTNPSTTCLSTCQKFLWLYLSNLELQANLTNHFTQFVTMLTLFDVGDHLEKMQQITKTILIKIAHENFMPRYIRYLVHPLTHLTSHSMWQNI